MNTVYAKIPRPASPREVVNASAALRREVPDRGSAVDAESRIAEEIGRELVGGVDQSPCCLKPWLNAFRLGQEVPPKNDWRETDATEGPTTKLHWALFQLAIDLAGYSPGMRGRRVGLPKGHNVAAELELA